MSRSYLFIPGDVPRMLQNLDVYDADAIIIDFEDAVSISEKDNARMLTHAFLNQYTFSKPEIYIRINAFEDKDLFNKDLDAIIDLNIKGIVLPKVSLHALTHLSNQDFKFPIIGLIETPEAYLSLPTIIANDLIEGVLLGAEDLSKALNLTRTVKGEEILYARSQLVMTAKALNKFVIDTPFVDVQDTEGLIYDANNSASLGFDAKASIHPNHVTTINEAFTPSKSAILEAKKIIHQHTKLNSMRFSLDGKMIDKPIIERAKKTLARATQYGVIQ